MEPGPLNRPLQEEGCPHGGRQQAAEPAAPRVRGVQFREEVPEEELPRAQLQGMEAPASGSPRGGLGEHSGEEDGEEEGPGASATRAWGRRPGWLLPARGDSRLRRLPTSASRANAGSNRRPRPPQWLSRGAQLPGDEQGFMNGILEEDLHFCRHRRT